LNEIIGKEYPLKNIFSKDFDFVIPPYQRPYSWTIEHVGQLFDDLYDFMVTQDENETYFLGSIVLIKDKNQTCAEVIDGQQRLISLTILLAAITSQLGDGQAQSMAKYVNEPGDEAEDIKPKPRLTLKPKDKDYFKKYIQDFNFNELYEINAQSLTDSQRNIIENAKFIQTKLNELLKGDRIKIFDFGKFIVNRCYIVAVSTSSMKSAYRIFSILNDRGLDLLDSDILKADIVGRISEENRENYTKKWEDLEDEIGRKYFNDLFGYMRMILLKRKLKKTILDELKEFLINEKFNPEKFMDNMLIPYADAYRIILNADYQNSQDPSQINATLRWLQRIDNSDWIPPSILFISKHSNDVEMLKRFFIKLERLAASLFIQRVGVNDRIDRYAKILAEIDSNPDITKINSSLDLSEIEINNTLEVIKGDIYPLSTRARNYLLLRLNYWLSDGLQWVDYKVLTVEHVLPQKPSENSDWIKKYNWSPQSREYWLHKLGNLALLSKRKNSEAQNYDFEKKKNKYFKSASGVSAFALTTPIIDIPDWTEDVVKKRQNEFVEKIKAGWMLE